jgi:hypothetical protein
MAFLMATPPLPRRLSSSSSSPLPLTPKAITVTSVALLSPLLTITRMSSSYQLLSQDITSLFYHGWQTSITSYRSKRMPALDRPYPLRGNLYEITVLLTAWIASSNHKPKTLTGIAVVENTGIGRLASRGYANSY